MFQNRPLRIALVVVLAAMIWLFLSDWSTASPQVRRASAALSALLALFAIGVATSGRALWALRTAAAVIGLSYVAYFVVEFGKLMGGERQPLAPGQPSATMGGIGLIIYAVPFLIFAISGFPGKRWRSLGDFWKSKEAEDDAP